VFWINCTDARTVATEIAQCVAHPSLRLGLALTGLSSELAVALVTGAWQSPSPKLVVFENGESQQLFERYRPGTGGSRIIVTSRLREWDARLAMPLLRIGPMDDEDGARLLSRYVPERDASDPTLRQIAGAIGGLPLYLHSAGCFLSQRRASTSPERFLDQIA